MIPLSSLFRPAVLLVLLLSLTSCAYKWGRNQRGIPGGYDKVAVPVFKNSTKEAGIEAAFTSAFIEEVQRNGLADVESKDNAQIVVEGRVEDVTYRQGARVKKSDDGYGDLPEEAVLTREYRVITKVSLKLRRRSDQKIIWSGTFSGERRYSPPQVTRAVLNTVNPLYNHSARRGIIHVLAKEIMLEAYNNLTENF